MSVVLQRVPSDSVVEGAETVAIGDGLVVLLGVARDDGAGDAARLAGRTARLQVFAGADGRFDRSILETGGAVLRGVRTSINESVTRSGAALDYSFAEAPPMLVRAFRTRAAPGR